VKDRSEGLTALPECHCLGSASELKRKKALNWKKKRKEWLLTILTLEVPRGRKNKKEERRLKKIE